MISAGDKEGEESISPDETFHTDAINKEKATYKVTLEKLKGLKQVIESDQKKVEADRLKLQSTFDKWYHQMCDDELFSSDSSQSRHAATHTKRSTSSLTAHGGEVDCAAAKQPSAEESGPDPEKEFKLPPGIQLTGNAEADEDIIAFYRAKSILLARRSC